MRRLLLLVLVVLSGAAFPLHAARADKDPQPAARPFARAPDPAEKPGPDADLFMEAMKLVEKRKWVSARRKFWRLIDKYPDSPYAPEAQDRSDPNAFLAITPMGPIGPHERRIDVALMADGYRLKEQKKCDKAFEGQLKVLLGEKLYEVYRPYFNFYQFNLASEDKGVDEPTPPEPDEELRERQRRKRRKKRGPKQYNTALDCKAAGPQGQVWANPRRVWHYLQYLDNHDSLAIVFAQMGRLGMGGMGIATTGPRGVVVHEFGHAFLGLLDEYANNPGEPQGFVNAPNATTSPDNPPWKHFLDAKYPGVGVYEGGATFKKGVWRPAPGCAMNSGGGSPYCPVCREAGVLRIYERVSPIDQVWPKQKTVRVAAGQKEYPAFQVLPMKPVGHALKVRWILRAAPPVTKSVAEPEEDDDAMGEEDLDPFEKRLRRLRRERDAKAGVERKGRGGLPTPIGWRLGTKRRARGTGGTPLPKGDRVNQKTTKGPAGVGKVHEARMPMKLPVGRHILTAIVWDPTPGRGKRRWVLKDDRGLLEDRHEWLIEVVADTPQAEPGK